MLKNIGKLTESFRKFRNLAAVFLQFKRGILKDDFLIFFCCKSLFVWPLSGLEALLVKSSNGVGVNSLYKLVLGLRQDKTATE